MNRRGWLAINLRVVGALGTRSIRQTLRRPQFFAPIVIFPSLFLAINTGGAGGAVNLPEFPKVNGFLDFELAGAMLQATMLAGVGGGIAIAMDIEMGFTDRLFTAPISRFAMVLGRLAATAMLGVMVAVYFIAIGLIFGAEIQAGIPGALLIVVLVSMCAVAFGGLAASLALRSGRASTVQGIFPLVFVVLFLSSAFFPRDLLLEPAKSFADGNPFSYMAEGLRDPVISGNISAEPLLKCLAAIALVTSIGVGLSAAALRARMRSG